MEELNNLEKELLNGLVKAMPQFGHHLEYLKVINREVTGVGMYINFDYKNIPCDLNVETISCSFSKNENIEIPTLKHGLGYEIDITDGRIKFIEIFTYDEVWEGKISGYKIVSEQILD